MSAITALGIENISKTFVSRDGSEVVALQHVTLAARQAEIITIVGPSGCGKSTLLRLLAGFEAPSEGRLHVGNAEIQGPSADRGMVFQQPQLYPWLTVFDNVVFGPRMRGMTKARYTEAAAHYIKSVGLSGFETNYPYQLSGGMKQRAQIARVLINEPRILLMDEPFGALDYQNRLVMQRLLLDLADQYKPTVLFITHDVEEAIFISDRVHVMSQRPGRILKSFDVNLPRPRDYETLSRDKEFIEMKVEILRMLQH